MDIKELYDVFRGSSGISTDSRTVGRGELFFALKGDRFNGNTKAKEALHKGAVKAVIDEEQYQSDDTILVDDVLATLQELARYHRSLVDIPVLGITGSNGKTTSKELIVAVLSQRYRVSATAGNYNNHIGVPLTLLRADRSADIWIVEMGTNAPGEIAFLAEMAAPTHGIITNIGKAHLEKLIDLEGVYREKTALYDEVLNNNGLIFKNLSDPYLAKYDVPDDKVKNYRMSSNEVGRIEPIDNGELFLIAKLNTEEGSHTLNTQLVGDYNLNNISAALSIGHHFGVKTDQMVRAINAYTPDNMRSQCVKTEKNTIILDAYNANPSSMMASLRTFCQGVSTEPKVLILGDMLELGSEAENAHQEIVKFATAQDGVELYLVGPIFRTVHSGDMTFDTVDDLIAQVQKHPIESSQVLIKGSRGVKLEKIITYL